MKSLLSLLLTVAIFSSIGCGGGSGSPGASGLSTKNNVVWHQLSDIERLNPYTSSDANASYVQQKIWEPLNFQHPQTLELMPGLASLPEESEDHLIYTYTMNPKAMWSDGKPLTTADVIFSFKAALNPKVVNSQALRNYLTTIDSAYNPGGDLTKVAFKLSKPYYDARSVLAGGYVPILPKHIMDPTNLTDKCSWADLHNVETTNQSIKEFALWFEKPEIARDAKYQIGSGPYVFKDWVTFSHITIKLNPNYWAKDIAWAEAYPDEIIFKTINDQNSALTALKAKDVDLIDNLKPDQFATQVDIEKQPFLRKEKVFFNAYTYIAWNNAHPLFADKQVRRALTMLIDRDEILKSVLKSLTRPIDGPIMFTQPNYDSTVKQVAYNFEEGKKALAAAGWSDTDGDGILDKVINGKKTPFKFTFQVNAGNETRKQILLIISEKLRKAGIEAGVTPLEWSVYLENTKSHNFEAAYGAWSGNATEDDVYQLWHSSQSKNKGSNYISFKNAELDKILEDFRVEFDKSKRMVMSRRLQEIFAEEQPGTFMFAGPLYLAMVNRYDNVEFFRQRPCLDVRYWMVKGGNIKKAPNAVPMGGI